MISNLLPGKEQDNWFQTSRHISGDAENEFMSRTRNCGIEENHNGEDGTF